MYFSPSKTSTPTSPVSIGSFAVGSCNTCFSKGYEMSRIVFIVVFVFVASAYGLNAKTLVMNGEISEQTQLFLRFEKAGLYGPGELPCDATNAAPYIQQLVVGSGTSAIQLRNQLVREVGGRGYLVKEPPSCYSGEVVTLTRAHVGLSPGVRIVTTATNPVTEYQVSVSTDGLAFSLLEPQVPVTINGMTFNMLLGDPLPTFVAPAPAIGAIGMLVLVASLMVVGIVLSRRSRRTV